MGQRAAHQSDSVARFIRQSREKKVSQASRFGHTADFPSLIPVVMLAATIVRLRECGLVAPVGEVPPGAVGHEHCESGMDRCNLDAELVRKSCRRARCHAAENRIRNVNQSVASPRKPDIDLVARTGCGSEARSARRGRLDARCVMTDAARLWDGGGTRCERQSHEIRLDRLRERRALVSSASAAGLGPVYSGSKIHADQFSIRRGRRCLQSAIATAFVEREHAA